MKEGNENADLKHVEELTIESLFQDLLVWQILIKYFTFVLRYQERYSDTRGVRLRSQNNAIFIHNTLIPSLLHTILTRFNNTFLYIIRSHFDQRFLNLPDIQHITLELILEFLLISKMTCNILEQADTKNIVT